MGADLASRTSPFNGLDVAAAVGATCQVDGPLSTIWVVRRRADGKPEGIRKRTGSGLHGCGGRIWTAEGRTVPSSPSDARHPVSTPSPNVPRARFGIALSLTRRRFHRLWRV